MVSLTLLIADLFLVCVSCAVFLSWRGAAAAKLARFEIREPLGQTWTDEWLTQEVTVDLGDRRIKARQLQLETGEGELIPCQFYFGRHGEVLKDSDPVSGSADLRILFRATVERNESVTFVVTDGGEVPRPWDSVTVTQGEARTIVGTGTYEVEFDSKEPLPINGLRCGSVRGTMGTFAWPEGVEATRVEDEWLETGPARVVLRRVFTFKAPSHRYEIVFDFRAGDSWLDVTDTYALGRGIAMELDLTNLNADIVYHPYAYNARTFGTGGPEEDSTLQPPQHPIATLGPIWRDIWFNGGPFAFVYNSKADHGIGFAAVRGSEWDTPEGITPESQNLEIHGEREKEGQVRVRIPADGGHRRWAIILGPLETRKKLSRMVRSHADIPLATVLKDWVLRWDSDARQVSYGFAGYFLGGHFNRHELNPTTYPRRVRSNLDRYFEYGHVKSRDLAALAYIFTDPDYWPGPRYKWRIGNPNFHTDMYSIPLRIGLLMPEHPHSKRWVQYGVEETGGDLMRNSYPGGAWQESLSYSAYFFRVVENARLLRDAGVVNSFNEWPRFKEVATYLACMHTPVDPRYGTRQKAPIGDTSPGNYVRQLRGMADLYRGVDDKFAEQLARFPEKWGDALDIGSRGFFGFGAMLRGNSYDERHESFVTIKAGPARNHFQGDELSFYFASLATPLAIDYACHYSPRPWSASVHNRPDMDGLRPVAVGVRRAMATSTVADLFAADERTTRISRVPMEPHKTTKPGWEYPVMNLHDDKPWIVRRYAMLVKHDPRKSRMADYLVIRDEIMSPEPVGWNLHVLARETEQRGQKFFFPGQLDVDMTAHFLSPEMGTIEKREWGWRGDSGARRRLKGDEYERELFGAYIPRDFERGTWGNKGEMAKWLRVKGPAGRTNWLVILLPHLRGSAAPQVEKLSDTSARVFLGDEQEIVHLGSEGKYQAAVERRGKLTVLLNAGEIKTWFDLSFTPIPPTRRGDR